MQTHITAKKRLGQYKTSLFLLGILLLGVCLRLINIENHSLWYDELQSVAFARLSIPDLMRDVFYIDPSPPLYYVILHIWMKITASDVWLRMCSVLFGLLSISAIYFIGNRLWSDRRAGLTAALFLSLSPYHIWFSQEVRMYSLEFFIALIVLYFTYQFLERKSFSKSIFSAYFLTTLLMLFVHGTSFFILFAQNAFFLFLLILRQLDRRRIYLWLTSQLVLVLLFLPYLYFNRTPPGHLYLPQFIHIPMFMGGYLVGMHNSLAHYSSVGLVLILVLLGGFLFREDKKKIALMFSFCLVPLLTAFIISYVYHPVFLSHAYFFTSIPLFILFPVILFHGKKAIRYTGRVVGIILLIAMGFSLLTQIRTVKRDDWRGAAGYLKSTFTQGNDLMISSFDRVFWTLNHYYLDGKETYPSVTDIRYFTGHTQNVIEVACKTEKLKKIEDRIIQYKRLFVIRPHFLDLSGEGFFTYLEETGFNEQEVRSFQGLDIHIYMRVET